MTKRSSPAVSGRGRRGSVREGYKVVALLLKPSLGLFGLVGRRWVLLYTQGLPSAIWLHQGITTLFSTSRYTLVLTFKPTSKMWGGMMWPWLETTPKTITVAGNFVFITLGTLNRPNFEGVGNVPVVITWISREHGCTAAHIRSRLLNIVSLSDMREGSYRSWDLYTTRQLVDGLQQKKKKKKEKKRKPVLIKRKWNHVVFSRATILSFHPIYMCIYDL